MRSSFMLTGSALMVSVVGASSPAQQHRDSTQWLKTNAIPMRTLELRVEEDNHFADLAPLAEHIRDARVVLLGEQTHGDGAAFLAKARLITWLHQEMGFGVLCFESGLYSCHKAQTGIESGIHAATAMETAIFPIWMRSKQVEPLTQYIEEQARGDNPLIISGYDCQLTGSASNQLIRDMVDAVTSATSASGHGESPAMPPADMPNWISGVGTLVNGTVTDDSTEASLRSLAKHFEQADENDPDGGHDWWAQVARSLAGHARYTLAATSTGPTLADDFNDRDQQGAENLNWILNEQYPDKKIVVWLASMHAIRDHGDIDTRLQLDYTGVRSMGDVLADEYLAPGDVYVIACTTYGGQAGVPWRQPWSVAPAPEGSFEDLCHKAGLDNAVIPLPSAEEAPFLHEEMLARPLGNQPMLATWPQHVDAFLFQREMTPSTPK